jgi:hypothetical protein
MGGIGGHAMIRCVRFIQNQNSFKPSWSCSNSVAGTVNVETLKHSIQTVETVAPSRGRAW